tara:strand:+ start:86 stop:598 length:513 start_codon:yes stop_codon:yes gene_type:complete
MYTSVKYGFSRAVSIIAGVSIGYTSMILFLYTGLIKLFEYYPHFQTLLKHFGSIFLIYLSVKIAISANNSKYAVNDKINFFSIFFFQFLNPKGVIAGIILVTNFKKNENNLDFQLYILLLLTFLFSLTSISTWTLLGKVIGDLVKDKKKIFFLNIITSLLLLVCVVMFYL